MKIRLFIVFLIVLLVMPYSWAKANDFLGPYLEFEVSQESYQVLKQIHDSTRGEYAIDWGLKESPVEGTGKTKVQLSITGQELDANIQKFIKDSPASSGKNDAFVTLLSELIISGGENSLSVYNEYTEKYQDPLGVFLDENLASSELKERRAAALSQVQEELRLGSHKKLSNDHRVILVGEVHYGPAALAAGFFVKQQINEKMKEGGVLFIEHFMVHHQPFLDNVMKDGKLPKVVPLEIERVLERHPSIRDVVNEASKKNVKITAIDSPVLYPKLGDSFLPIRISTFNDSVHRKVLQESAENERANMAIMVGADHNIAYKLGTQFADNEDPGLAKRLGSLAVNYRDAAGGEIRVNFLNENGDSRAVEGSEVESERRNAADDVSRKRKREVLPEDRGRDRENDGRDEKRLVSAE